MKKFKFRLQRILDIHNSQLSELMSQLSVIRQEIEILEHKNSENVLLSEELDRKIASELKKSMSAKLLLAGQFEKKTLKCIQDALNESLQNLRLQEADCLNRLMLKKREVTGFEKLREKQQSEHRLQSQRSDNRELENLLNK